MGSGKSGVGATVDWRRIGRAAVLLAAMLATVVGVLGVSPPSEQADQTVIVTPVDTGPCSRSYPYNSGPGVLALEDSYSAGEGLRRHLVELL